MDVGVRKLQCLTQVSQIILAVFCADRRSSAVSPTNVCLVFSAVAGGFRTVRACCVLYLP